MKRKYLQILNIIWIVALGIALLQMKSAGAAVVFNHTLIDSQGPNNIWLKAVGDLNGDGQLDLVAGGNGSGGLVWYQSPNWSRHIISSGSGFSTDGEVADVDRDGDADVVVLTSGDIRWYENPSWNVHIIESRVLHDVEVADLDGDGDVDLVARDQGEFGHSGNVLHLYRQDSPTTWTHRSINCTNGEGLKLVDVDRDGDLDPVIGGTWFENTRNILSGAWTAYSYTTSWTHPNAFVASGDINRDGRVDLVLAPAELAGGTYRISWFEAPVNPRNGNWVEHIVENNVETDHHFVGVGDMDNDGDADIAAAEMQQGTDPDEVKVYLNGDGAGGTWSKQVLATSGSHSMRILDVGRDGDLDLYGANWQSNQVELWENQTNPTTIPTNTAILSPTRTNTPLPGSTSTPTPASSGTITIGETNILGTDDSGNGNLLVAQQAMLAQSATIQSLSFYVTTAAGRLRLGIYDATGPGGGPGALRAQTAEFTPTTGWNTRNVVTPTQLNAGTYWLTYLPESSGLHFRMTPNGSGRWYGYTYGPLPATYSTSPLSGSYHWSFYATLLVGAVPTSTSTNAPVRTPTSSNTPVRTPTPTNTPVRTPTSSPTIVVTRTNTPGPSATAGSAQIYDFNSSTLGTGWTFVNPVGDSTYSLTNNPGHLQISVPPGVPHDCWTGVDRCPRMVRNAAAGDATYEVKIDGNPLTSNYQVYGIFLYQNSTNYLRFEYWYGLGNLYVRAWKIINGTGSEAIGGPAVALTGADSLQVTKTGNTYLLKYKLGSTGTWQTAGSFVQTGFSPAQVGIGVINEGSNLSTTAQVDYFSITSP